MPKTLLSLYRGAEKAVHGALVATVPVVLVCVQQGASVEVTALSALGALLGVGGVVYKTDNT